MKERQLREHTTCNACQQPIGHTGLPLFWTVAVTRWGLDARALQRQQGLAMHLGSAALAMVMGPDEDLAKPIDETVTLTVCETCAYENPLLMAALAEGE
jgi:hypothetical protein